MQDKRNNGNRLAGLGITSNAFNNFVKKHQILKGIRAGSGRADSLFREIVHTREREFAMHHSRIGGAKIKLGGEHGHSKDFGIGGKGGTVQHHHLSEKQHVNRMNFDDFLLAVSMLAKTVDPGLAEESANVCVHKLCSTIGI